MCTESVVPAFICHLHHHASLPLPSRQFQCCGASHSIDWRLVGEVKLTGCVLGLKTRWGPSSAHVVDRHRFPEQCRQCSRVAQYLTTALERAAINNSRVRRHRRQCSRQDAQSRKGPVHRSRTTSRVITAAGVYGLKLDFKFKLFYLWCS